MTFDISFVLACNKDCFNLFAQRQKVIGNINGIVIQHYSFLPRRSVEKEVIGIGSIH